MPLATSAQTAPKWTIDTFKAFWAKPDPAYLPAVAGIVTDDLVGYWPRPIGTVRGRNPYMKVLADILAVCPDFSVAVAEYAASGDFHFVRWIATGTGPDGPFEFTGTDRLRTRAGLVCENYIFCDDPFFERVATYGAKIAACA